MNWSINLIPNQDGRIALVTGANSGLGFETAKTLLNKGARVILGCRTLKKAQIARQRLLNENPHGKIEILEIDLSDLNEVNRAADDVVNKYKTLDLLVNNAGVMAPPRTLSKQGFELQFAVNHLSHMALTLKLLPLLSNQGNGRVVTVSSGAQFLGSINWNDLHGLNRYDRWASYSQSKLANVMFALELDKKLKAADLPLASLCAHPGLARTNLQHTSIAANSSWQDSIAYKLMDPMFQSASMGSLPQLYAATDPNARSGHQYGPRFNFRGLPRLCGVASLALQIKERQKLWEVSEELIGNIIPISCL